MHLISTSDRSNFMFLFGSNNGKLDGHMENYLAKWLSLNSDPTKGC